MRLGYRVPDDAIPISMENAQTDYDESIDTAVTFRLSGGGELMLFFAPGRQCFLFPDDNGRTYSSPALFRSRFAVTVGVVPVLGPVEHEEPYVEDQTVSRNLATHRASRHFRNYWLRAADDEFDRFRSLLQSTWRGMDIKRPEIMAPPRSDRYVAMFCIEQRIERELFWAGFGFQVWCQILTHVLRAKLDSIVVIDEPEIYLHPDLQRQLLAVLRDLGPDVLVATHSSEIVSQVEPSDILLVSKAALSARRVGGIEGVRAALDRLGSVQNVALTQLARTRRVLFVEGDDMSALVRFARRLELPLLASGAELAPFPTGGFPRIDSLRAVCEGIRKTLGGRVHFAGVFDRDYRCQEEVDTVLGELESVLEVPHVWRRKELENYLLVPAVLQRAAVKAIQDRMSRTGSLFVKPSIDISQMLIEITDQMRVDLSSQLIASRVDFFKRTSPGISAATVTAQATREVESQWATLEMRLNLAPGKEVLTHLNGVLQDRFEVALTPRRIIDEFRPAEVPSDLAALLRKLEVFCASK